MKCQRKETLQIDSKTKETNTEQIIHWSKYNKKHDCRATGVSLTGNSISIQEIDWQKLDRSFWTQKGLRLNVTRTHAEKLLNQRQTLLSELLYWNLSKIHPFFSGECGLCWNWWKDYSVLTRNHRSHSPHGTLSFSSSEHLFSFRSL